MGRCVFSQREGHFPIRVSQPFLNYKEIGESDGLKANQMVLN